MANRNPADFAGLVDELGARALEIRELLREARGTVGDLRRERRELETWLATAIRDRAEARFGEMLLELTEEIKAHSAKTVEVFQDRMDRIGEKVLEELQRLAGDARETAHVAGVAAALDDRPAVGPGNHCVECRRLIPEATRLRGQGRPRAGSLSICAYCGHVAVFLADGRLREPTAAELEAALADEEVAELVTIAAVHAARER